MDIEEQYNKIYRYCYMKTRDHHTSEDLTQETFLRFLENHSYREIGKQMAYLYVIARNLCNDYYRCKICGRLVTPQNAGSNHRNHCPNCLSSLHVDIEPSDRASDCGGIMEPVAVWVRKGGEWAIIHRCKRCGNLSSNRVAADDNPMKLMSIAMKPLCKPPFPLERIEEITVLMGGDGTMK